MRSMRLERLNMLLACALPHWEFLIARHIRCCQAGSSRSPANSQITCPSLRQLCYFT